MGNPLYRQVYFIHYNHYTFLNGDAKDSFFYFPEWKYICNLVFDVSKNPKNLLNANSNLV